NLRLGDVTRLMDNIFAQHVTQKKMTAEIMRRSIAHYINQFDPHHVYLLAADVEPFLGMSPSNLDYLVDEYNKGDFSIFDALNSVIQKAIHKMRDFRRLNPLTEEHFKKIDRESLPTFTSLQTS